MEIKKVSFVSLGCRVNQYESNAIASDFEEMGYIVTRDRREADIIVVNTCCVTRTSESKSRRCIRHLHTENANAVIIVTGCYSQRAGHDLLSIPGVGMVTGNGEKENLAAMADKLSIRQMPLLEVGNIMQRKSFPAPHILNKKTGRIREYLKVQDGCSQFCTYCIVPYVRGPVVSRPVEDVIAEAKSIESNGFRELVLTGIHTGLYGTDFKNNSDNSDNKENKENIDITYLLKRLLEETTIPRIRLGSLESKEITDELIELVANNNRVCNHFHIPLQSGDDEVLAKMGRPYTRTEYLDLIKKIYKAMPDAAISSDIMVGFPGETDGAFENTIDIMANAEYSYIHAFPYSPREGTKAAIFPNRVPSELKNQRQKLLLSLGEFYKNRFAERHIWQEVELLVETKDKNGYYRGHTGNFLEVRFKSDEKGLCGKLVKVKIHGNDNGLLLGDYIK